jgi:intron-binding protein aquarius
MHDYLQRNFNLFRLESTYEIREDIASTVSKLRPRLNNAGTTTVFTGWARMALPIYSFSITSVKKPDIGETKPALVRGEITVDLSPFSGKVREEWESLRDHDVLFLITYVTKYMSSIYFDLN